jgi:RNA polymerase sigma-70 factor (ECF subfamily)
VGRARDGDQDAFRELVERTQDRIHRLTMRVLRCDSSTAEDLCQEIYLRAYRGLPRFDGAVRFGTWLHTIAMNACISEYRRRRTLKRGSRRTVSIDAPIGEGSDLHIDPPSHDVDPRARADQREFAEAVRFAVAELPEEFRHAVLLRDMQGLSYEEIGEVLGVPPGTVRSRIHRGRLLLQDILREYSE